MIEGRHDVREGHAGGEADQRAQSLCKAERAPHQERGLVRTIARSRPLRKGGGEGVGRKSQP